MTENRRIFLNIVATYGRSVYSLIIGLLCGRWALMALGQVDYGLMGVVGGLTAFISFFNGLLSSSIGRFYAFSVGKESANNGKDREFGLLECQHWFSIAVMVHTIVPVVLILVGYPAGEWTVRHFLTIPPDRVDACVWVWRFVCVTCFLGMASVPFNAMYTAKQYIAELTIYSFITTTLNAVFLYYMVSHPGVWLTRYAFWQCFLGVVPNVIIAARAVALFKECRFDFHYCFDVQRLKQLASFAFWQFFGSFGWLVRQQGVAILVNKYFGPALNATMNLGNSVAAHTETLSNALYGAFSPAITNKAGAGGKEEMLSLAYRASKFGSVLCLLFALPLSLELPFVLKLWLKNPPPQLTVACLWTILFMLQGQLMKAADLSVVAMGRIGKYSFIVGGFMILTFPVNWVLLHYDICGFMSVFYVLVAFRVLILPVSLPLAKRLVGFSPEYWLVRIVIPVLFAASITLLIGMIPLYFLSASFLRLVVVGVLCELVFLPVVWLVILNKLERAFVSERLKLLFGKIRQRRP